MSFRTRLGLSFAALALVPLLVFGYGVQREMSSRLDAETARRVTEATQEIRADLEVYARNDRSRLHALALALGADNRFRLAMADPESNERRWLLDWAGGAMSASGLSVLLVQDSAGHILSSGHFRNDFDRRDPALPIAIHAVPDSLIIVQLRTPDGLVRALASMDSFAVAGRKFTIVGGRGLDSARVATLARDREIRVGLIDGDSVPPIGVVAEVSLPYFEDQYTSVPKTARFVLTRDMEPSRALRRSVNLWLLGTLGGTLLAALLIAAWLARRISKPIADLADKTARLDLDRLDQDFSTNRGDEIGSLSRLLAAMTTRLKTGAARLRDAERQAATGELARQVNHDIKNGLAPIRNVVRHLTQVAEREPDKLVTIYMERQKTLDSSMAYLDDLARNYAKLSPALDHSGCDAGRVVREVAGAVSADGARIETRVAEVLPKVRADAVVLRRVLANLLSNAVEALDGMPGRVTVSAELAEHGDDRSVRFTIADTGRGMSKRELDRAFDDFYTTKPTGTGLGLSVVRRLLMDLGGSIRVETAPGEGSTFIVEIPAA